MLYWHPSLTCWPERCDNHYGCQFDHFLSCCIIIMLSPYFCMNWWWISMGKHALPTETEADYTNFHGGPNFKCIAIAQQLILCITSDWLNESCIIYCMFPHPTSSSAFQKNLHARGPYLLNVPHNIMGCLHSSSYVQMFIWFLFSYMYFILSSNRPCFSPSSKTTWKCSW
jgi:hypothetical protein